MTSIAPRPGTRRRAAASPVAERSVPPRARRGLAALVGAIAAATSALVPTVLLEPAGTCPFPADGILCFVDSGYTPRTYVVVTLVAAVLAGVTCLARPTGSTGVVEALLRGALLGGAAALVLHAIAGARFWPVVAAVGCLSGAYLLQAAVRTARRLRADTTDQAPTSAP